MHVFDRNDSGPKPGLARSLGAQAVAGCAPGGIVCLTGLGGEHSIASFDAATLNQSLVLEPSARGWSG